jgi:hypothetical protein
MTAALPILICKEVFQLFSFFVITFKEFNNINKKKKFETKFVFNGEK